MGAVSLASGIGHKQYPLYGAPPAVLDGTLTWHLRPHVCHLQLAHTSPRGSEGVRYATRAALLLERYLRATGQYGEAHASLMKAHFQVGGCRM